MYSFESSSHVWAIYNTLADNIAQLATQYTLEQLRFISDSSQYRASILDAMTQASGELTKKQCEDLMDSLVADYWLVRTTTAELEGYLREEGLFFDCGICKNLVTTKVGHSASVCIIELYLYQR
ncbi:hypothetical protein PSACC_03086 [Paramicrosporidium saccamoebae]|uniref:Uncharacterized protein n=1 Tax=Paramicrosporidium saccamoebae TaxID=1246581 RepID=A0A2H9TH11_9FUNG|nr:hypothetical protein PSACC_03086 [Paramicrosporidium saccamoebae]